MAALSEAALLIAGKSYPVALNIGAMARIATALGVQKYRDLQVRLLEVNLPDMPLVVAALLKANGHEVAPEAIERMDPLQYLDQVLPAIFPKKSEGEAADEANPPTSPATTTS